MKSKVGFVLGFSVVVGLLVAGPLATSNARNARRPQFAIQAAGRGNPWINLKDGEELQPAFSRESAGQSLISDGRAEPTALASADFDEDGMPDLVSGYAATPGGIITLHRGNEESLYPKRTSDEAANPAAHRASPFHPEARAFELTEAPDFIGAGDFNNDGHWDVVAALRGSNVLQLLPGDGHGGFGSAELIPLSGFVTAMTVGEINRADGLADVIAGVDGRNGPQVLVFEGPSGALKAMPESIALQSPANSLVLGQLDDNYEFDLAIAAGSQLMIVHGRDRNLSLDESKQEAVAAPKIDRQSFGFNIAALSSGEFVWDREHRVELALLSDAGDLLVLTRGTLDRRPFTDADLKPRASQATRKNNSVAQKLETEQQANTWAQASSVSIIQSANGTRQSTMAMATARVSGLPTDDLVVLDPMQHQMHIVGSWALDPDSWVGERINKSEFRITGQVSLDTESAPIAALPMRLNADAISDLVVLRHGSSAPSVIVSATTATFTVNSTGDTDDGACTAGPGGCTLREAINAANSSPANDTIDFNIPGDVVHTITPLSPLPITTNLNAVTIDATAETCGSPHCVELNGSSAGGGSGLDLRGDSSVVRGLVINRFSTGSGIRVASSNSIIEGNFLGTDVNGTGDLGNSLGASVEGINNTIGGTTSAARNVLSGNNFGVTFSTGGHQVQGNYIGTDLTGTSSLGNAISGVEMGTGVSSTNLVIGGTTFGAGNLISANGNAGVTISGTASTGHLVQGNFIGTNVSGNGSIGNFIGVRFLGTQSHTIGGTAEAARNLISGNTSDGVLIAPTSFISASHVVQGNFIGTNVSGNVDLGNGGHGVNVDAGFDNLIGGSVSGAGNLISGNTGDGVHIESTQINQEGNDVIGNLIGTNFAGTADLGNSGNGVYLNSLYVSTIGGTTAGARNIISGNDLNGVHLEFGAGHFVQGNYIGTNVSGTAALGNTEVGVLVGNASQNNTIGGAAAGARNIISGNNGNGVEVKQSQSTGNVIQGNYIGTDVNGNSVLANSGDGLRLNSLLGALVGGTAAGEGNVISGSGANGIRLFSCATITMQGNYIGSNAAGTTDLGNTANGIFIGNISNSNTVGGSAAGAGNQISGNGQNGVEIAGSTGNVVLGNSIGTNSGGLNLGNTQRGVFLSNASSASIGGTNAGEGNRILFNGLDGVGVEIGTGNRVLGNKILSNGELGIDLDPNGVSPNDVGDADTGANNLQNFPVLASAMLTSPTAAVITGTFNSTANRMFRLEFFVNTTCDGSGNGEGEELAATATVTTNGSGNFSISQSVPYDGRIFYTATATDLTTNDTSEFSACIEVDFQQTGPTFTVNNNSDTDDGFCGTVNCSLREAINAANAHPNSGGPDTVAFNIPGAGPHNIKPTSELPSISNPVIIDGLSQAGASCNALKIELDGSLAGGANGLTVISGGGGSTISGLVINLFNNGVSLSGSNDNHLECNFLGTDVTGTINKGNSRGVNISFAASNNFIGGLANGAGRNLISGNSLGIQITGTSSGNNIRNNFIGTDITGLNPLGNSTDGVNLGLSALNNVVGNGTGLGNVIAFNGEDGIALAFSGLNAGVGNFISGNSIHSNGQLGIDLNNDGVTPNDAGDGDPGSNNLQNFPLLDSSATGATTSVNGRLDAIAGNYTLEFFANPGCDASGNGEGKVFLGFFTFTHPGGGLVGFLATGLAAAPSGNLFITAIARRSATNDTSEFSACVLAEMAQPGPTFTVTKTADTNDGVCSTGDCSLREAIGAANGHVNSGGPDTIAFNIPGAGPHSLQPTQALPPVTEAVIIDGLTQAGAIGASPTAWPPTLMIEIDGSLNLSTQPGLRIGSGGGGSTIRGLVINRCKGTGIGLDTSNNVIEGNFIGTNVAGTLDRGNLQAGISILTNANTNTIGGSTPDKRNLISGNDGGGIVIIQGSSNVVQGNYIGTDVTGLLPIGNTFLGVSIQSLSNNNLIGGDSATGNVIAFNSTDGVGITGGTSNAVQGNSIFSNTELGIDLGSNGVDTIDVGDGDSGANNLQNAPQITSTFPGATVNVFYKVDSTTGNSAYPIRVEFFLADVANQEGKTPIGLDFYTSPFAQTIKLFSFVPAAPIGVGAMLVATATDAAGNTSEFSAPVTAPTAVELIGLTATSYSNGTLVEWQTGFEVDNLGFRLYREQNGRRALVNREIIAGSALKVGASVAVRSGNSYSWWDGGIDDCRLPNADCQSTQYWLEDLDLNGQSKLHGPFKVIKGKGKAPAFVQAVSLNRLGQDVVTSQASVSQANETVSALSVKPIDTAGKAAVKLQIKEGGWYRVTQRELAAAGFDTRINPRNLQLLVGGVEQAALVNGESDGSFDAADSVEFYGTGQDTQATDSRVYWLVASTQRGKRINTVESTGKPGGAQSFLQTVERRERSIYFSALLNGEAENFFGSVIAAQSVDQSLTLQHLDANNRGSAELEIALQGVTTVAAKPGHSVSVVVNGTTVGRMEFDGREHKVERFSIAQSVLREGENRITLKGEGGASDVSLVHYVRVGYWRTYAADGNALQVTASSSNGPTQTISGFTSPAIRVFDVSDAAGVSEIAGQVVKQENGYAVTVTVSGKERSLIALTDDRIKRPVSISLDQASNLRSPAQGADLIIISRREFFDAIAPLASLRKSQGLSVAVVDLEDVYDEFNYGEKSAQAVKHFLAYAQTNWKKKPQFVLLGGDGSYDPKDYLGFGDSDVVPSKLIDTTLMETASDDWFVDFNDDGVAELAVGRLPFRTVSEAQAMVAKLTSYETSSPLQEVLFAADENDGFSFEGASDQLQSLMPVGLRVNAVYRGQMDPANARAALLKLINSGQKVVNYIGHGSLDVWRGGLLSSADAGALTNRNGLALFVMMTCLNGYYTEPARDSIGEALLKSDGGAIAVWASSGMCPPGEQAAMNRALYQAMFGPENRDLKLGNLLQRAKQGTADPDIRRTWVLLGDPSMTLR